MLIYISSACPDGRERPPRRTRRHVPAVLRRSLGPGAGDVWRVALFCTPQRLEDIRRSLGTDRPVAEQFTEYFKGLAVGREIYVSGAPRTMFSAMLGLLVPHRYRSQRGLAQVPQHGNARVDDDGHLPHRGDQHYSSRRSTTGHRVGPRGGRVQPGFRLDPFLLGLLFALYTTVLYPILPRPPTGPTAWATWFVGLIAPAIILGLIYARGYVRYARASMVDTLNQDYVRTAQSKGIQRARSSIDTPCVLRSTPS